MARSTDFSDADASSTTGKMEDQLDLYQAGLLHILAVVSGTDDNGEA